MKPSFFVFILLVIFSSISGADEAPSVRTLGVNESLVVKYTSTGCFHNSTSVLVFTSGKVSMYSVKLESPDEKKEQVEEKKHLGDVQLSEEDVTKLEALFKFYADGPDQGCTTVDYIKVSLQKDDKVVKTYEFTDGSCSTYDMKSVLTFGELIGKAKK